MAIPATLIKLVRSYVPEPTNENVICTGSRAAHTKLRCTTPFIELPLALMTTRRVRWVAFMDESKEQDFSRTFQLRNIHAVVALEFNSEEEARLRAVALAAGAPAVLIVRSIPPYPLDVGALAKNQRSLPSPAKCETMNLNTMVPAGRDSEAKINVVVSAKDLKREQVFAKLKPYKPLPRSRPDYSASAKKLVVDEEKQFRELLDAIKAGSEKRVEGIDKKRKDQVMLEMLHNEHVP